MATEALREVLKPNSNSVIVGHHPWTDTVFDLAPDGDHLTIKNGNQLDRVVFQPVDVLILAGGFSVLLGARMLVQHNRPLIIMRCDASDVGPVCSLLAEFGYTSTESEGALVARPSRKRIQ